MRKNSWTFPGRSVILWPVTKKWRDRPCMGEMSNEIVAKTIITKSLQKQLLQNQLLQNQLL